MALVSFVITSVLTQIQVFMVILATSLVSRGLVHCIALIAVIWKDIPSITIMIITLMVFVILAVMFASMSMNIQAMTIITREVVRIADIRSEAKVIRL